MKNWQKSRNYRKHENADGFFTFIINVGGKAVEVSEAVFEAYSTADRRERYITERDAGRLLSLELMDIEDILLKHFSGVHIESAEDTAFRMILIEQSVIALNVLDVKERQLIYALEICGVTEKAYADTIGLTQAAVHKRKKRILRKIKNMVIKP